MKAVLLGLITRTWPKRTHQLTLELPETDFTGEYELLKGAPVEVTIRPWRKSRSKNANAYAWQLMDKLAVAITVRRQKPFTKEDVYREAIREIPDVSEIVMVRAEEVERFRRKWAHQGLGWQSEIVGKDPTAPGYVDICVYSGSSVYDTRQMSALLDCLVAEAQALGVATDTPEKIEMYKYYWAQAEREAK